MKRRKSRPGRGLRLVVPLHVVCERARRATASGLAMLLLAALLTSCGLGAAASIHLEAIFPSTTSLYPKAAVKVLGMTVGTVQSIKVVGDTEVQVAFTVRRDVPLPRGVSAVIVPESLLGARYIQLFPAWVDGQPQLDPGDAAQRVIPMARTSVPVEPDEALSALNNLLKALNPQATGQLITNLNADLAGNGQNLNDAITSLSGLSNTLADKDQDLVAIIDNLQQFTTVLDTRETQLGQVLDLFAQTTSLLAQERNTIASLVTSLAGVSTNALDLVSKHAAPLQSDIKELSDLVQTLDGNLGNVSSLLSSLPQLVAGPNLDSKAGLIAAYNPTYHRIDLRDSLGSTINGLLQALGLPLCLSIPLLDTQPQCAPGSIQLQKGAPASATAAAKTATKDGAPAPGGEREGTGATAASPASPLAAVLNLLGSGGLATPQMAGYGLVAAPPAAAQQGPLATAAHWAHDALERLW